MNPCTKITLKMVKRASRLVRTLLGKPEAILRKADLLWWPCRLVLQCVCGEEKLESCVAKRAQDKKARLDGADRQDEQDKARASDPKSDREVVWVKEKNPSLVQGYSSICYLIRWERIWAEGPTQTHRSSQACDEDPRSRFVHTSACISVFSI